MTDVFRRLLPGLCQEAEETLHPRDGSSGTNAYLAVLPAQPSGQHEFLVEGALTGTLEQYSLSLR